MSVPVHRFEPVTADVGAATVTAIAAALGVKVVWVTSSTALWLCYGHPDGATLPTTARFPILAGTYWPVQIEADGRTPSLCSQSGTASVSLLGEG